MRHLGHECLREAEQPAAPVGGFAAGEGDLRGHALAPFRGRGPCPGLAPALGGIKGHVNPGLQPGDDAFEVLQARQLIDQPGIVRAKQQRTRRRDQVLHAGTARSGAGRNGIRAGGVRLGVVFKRGPGKGRVCK